MMILLSGGGSPSQVMELDVFFSNYVKNGKILYIPIAMEKKPYSDCEKWFRQTYGKYNLYNIEMCTDLSKVNSLDEYTAIFIGGGNTYKLLKEIKKSNFDKKLKSYLESGGFVYGGSAGAIIFGKSIDTSRDNNNVGLSDLSGLNLLDGYDIWCHYDQKRDYESIIRIKNSTKVLYEESGLLYDGNTFKTIGREGLDFPSDFMNKNDYYKAYDLRYRQVHALGKLWEFKAPSGEVLDFLKDYKEGEKILELGCGEGRDALELLNKGYSLLATDYSKEAIDKCNELSNNKYISDFKTLDFLTEELDGKYDYIYSISVLHMLVLKEHRIKFLSFIKNHLKDNGKALITVLGDGVLNKCTSIDDAFSIVERNYQNTDEIVKVSKTSCNIVDWMTLEEEIKAAGLIINKKWISEDIPGFNPSMCVVVGK